MSSFIKTIAFNNPRKLISNVFIRTFTKAELPQFETLAVSVPKKHVYHVELNRPKKSNSFSRTMWQEINQCFTTLSLIPECRVIVLSGQGKHFCGGIELQSLVQLAAEADELEDVARKARYHYNFIKYAQETISSLEECVKPVISVTHNACIGAGVNLITAADMRYCTEDCWFSVREVDVGLAPDVGTLQRFPKIVGNSSVARELCFTGRNFDAKEAKEIGLCLDKGIRDSRKYSVKESRSGSNNQDQPPSVKLSDEPRRRLDEGSHSPSHQEPSTRIR
ncbi:hypothetical protein HW555_012672 [Spodoptera exigua]|uniref:Uncharacterized protein n=1 Tax=Spodoptera exigua TaxID=7107 RepID=A0A835KXQ5_SPOEX|nr:hypothetical protein HW555_012672 [Spodoptera exigua]